MWTAEDKEIAERAAQILAKLQGRKRPGILEELKSVRDQVANKRSDEHERAEAWLSICRLVESIETSPTREISMAFGIAPFKPPMRGAAP
jgi:hypothetical protein